MTLKKKIKWFLLSIFILLAGIIIYLYITIKVPSISDGKLIGTVMLPCSDTQHPLPYNIKPLPDLALWTNEKDSTIQIEKFLKSHNTAAFLVLHKDTIVYERYFNGFKPGEATQVFSITKSLFTSLLGFALQDGYIHSLDQPVSDFVPDLPDKFKYKDLTLYHLAQMQSGFNDDEYGNLLQTLRFYWDKDVGNQIKRSYFKYKPGQKFVYKSIDTQLLGECLEKATGKKPLDYFNERIWSQLGAEDSAFWTYDSPEHKELKYYSGLNATPRDLAKYASVWMHDGQLNGKQIIPKFWVNFCDDDSRRNGKGYFCMGWWYDWDDEKQDIYFGAGFNGQIMFINETTQTAIIRLGTSKGGINWYDCFKKLSNCYQ